MSEFGFGNAAEPLRGPRKGPAGAGRRSMFSMVAGLQKCDRVTFVDGSGLHE